MYSAILNYQNLVEVDKFGMTVELDVINPGIARYTRMYCQILEFSQMTKDVLTAPLYDDNVPSGTQQRTETQDNICNDKLSQNGILNENLSGFYVIVGIEYFLTRPGGLRQRLHLRRREVVPST